MSRSTLLRMRNISDKSFTVNQNTHFVFSYFFFLKSCRFWDNIEKYYRAGQAIDDNMAHAHCMLVNYGYTHTLTICRHNLLFLHCDNGCKNEHQCYAYIACLSCLFPLHLNPLQPRPPSFTRSSFFLPARDYKCKSQPEYRWFSSCLSREMVLLHFNDRFFNVKSFPTVHL